MPSGSDGQSPAFYRPPQPLLLPSNRKLRHLSAISLRNLGMPLPPTKESLRNADADADDDDEDLDLNPAKALERRRRRRRRSSGSLTPAQVQERVAQRRGDVYFTLHSPPDCGQPVYTSEVVPRSMNPDFLLLDLSKHGGPSVSRSGEVAIKVFCNYGNGWIQTVEDEVHLAGLSFLGRVLESCNKRLPENCVVWHLTDGCYAWLEGEPPAEAPGWDANAVVTTSSYDSLLKLNTLGVCIEDAEATTARLSSQASAVLESEKYGIALPSAVDQAQERLKTTRKYIAIEHKRLEDARRRADHLKASIAARRTAMQAAREAQALGKQYLEDNHAGLARSRMALASTREAITAQHKRIVGSLMEIYPIMLDPSSAETLAFTICGMHLPSVNYNDFDDATVSAALGYVAHVIYLLSFYIGVSLLYPVQPMGSRSFVRDDISQIQGPRTFPLWMRGTAYFRFQYGVFLINKNVQQLMSRVGLHCIDIRYTLPNLKSLMLFIKLGGNPTASASAGASADASARSRGGPTALTRSATPNPPGSSGGGDGLRVSVPPRPHSHCGTRTPVTPGKGLVLADVLPVFSVRPYSLLVGRGRGDQK